jgi:hypothetical protein
MKILKVSELRENVRPKLDKNVRFLIKKLKQDPSLGESV